MGAEFCRWKFSPSLPNPSTPITSQPYINLEAATPRTTVEEDKEEEEEEAAAGVYENTNRPTATTTAAAPRPSRGTPRPAA